MTCVAYVWASALWAIAGLISGYVLGRAGSNMAEKATLRRTISDTWLGIILVMLALVTVLGLTISNQQTEARIRCQTQFNSAFISALEERSAAARSERQAQRDLLTAVAVPRADIPEALSRYRVSLDRADAERSRNPYPAINQCEDAWR